jgi:predicted transcriptional regulator
MSAKLSAERSVQTDARASASVKADADESTTRRTGSDSTSDEQIKKEKGTVRLSLDVSVELNKLINQLAKETNSTKSDVLRRAVTLLNVAIDAKQQGKKIGIAEKDQPLTTEIIWL